jgi:hypothetical protein
MEFRKERKRKREKVIDTILNTRKPHTPPRNGGTTKMIPTRLRQLFLVTETHRLRIAKWRT